MKLMASRETIGIRECKKNVSFFLAILFFFSQFVISSVFRRLILRVCIRNIMILRFTTFSFPAIFHVTSRDGTAAGGNKMREIGEE